MCRIDENSFYLSYTVNPKGEESAYLVHFKEVWDNGYTIDSYTFWNKRIGFENASWTGVNPNVLNLGTRILGRYFYRWSKLVEDCKFDIEKMVKKSSTPYNNEWQDGDYLYIDMTSILAEDNADDYKGPDFYLVRLTDSNPENPMGVDIVIDKYDLYYKNEPSSQKEFLDYFQWIYNIPKETYDNAKNMIDKVYTELMSEIRKVSNKSLL